MTIRNKRQTAPAANTFFTVMIASFFALLTFASAESIAAGFEVIPLKYRPAQMILPSLQAVASDDTQITAANNQLILKGDAAEVAQIRALIETLDTPLAQFRISLRQNNTLQQNSSAIAHDFEYQRESSSGNIRIGTTTLDGKPVPPSQSGSGHSTYSSTTYVKNRSTQSRGNTHQTINALEGHPARIETGKEIPFLSRNPYDATVTEDYKPVTTGFYVTPTASGDNRVTLDISAQKQKIKRTYTQEIDTAGFSSTINARLGEWINVGGALESAANNRKSTGKRYRVNSSDQYQLELKVERIH